MITKALQMAMLAEFAAREVAYVNTRNHLVRGSLDQMKAVCYCIRARVRSGWHDGDWIKVMEAADECAAHERHREIRLDPDSRPLQLLLMEIEDLYYGAGEKGSWASLGDSLVDCRYWMFLDRPQKPWFQEKIIRQPHLHPERSGGLMTMKFFE